jgi:ferrous iron transport protein B
MFVLVMGGMFYTLFTLAAILMDLIEATSPSSAPSSATCCRAGTARPGRRRHHRRHSGTVVFLPQICLLFFLISLLEDTGYLARAAFVMDRLLYRFGLPGHAFVPLLTAHACALPGIMSARLIPDRRDRLATILIAPMMSCSARLPVYVLLTSLLFVDRPVLAGLAFAGCYLLGAAMALATAFVFGRSVLKGRARPMVLELPSYKVPSFTNALLAAKDQGFAFLRTAGTIIMAICVVMWWLSAYPKATTPVEVEQLRASAERLSDEGLREAASTRPTRWRTARRVGRSPDPSGARCSRCSPRSGTTGSHDGRHDELPRSRGVVSTMSVLVGAGAATTSATRGLGRIRTATRDDGGRCSRAHQRQPARVLRAGDAMPADVGGHPSRNGQRALGRPAAGLHVDAGT